MSDAFVQIQGDGIGKKIDNALVNTLSGGKTMRVFWRSWLWRWKCRKKMTLKCCC